MRRRSQAHEAHGRSSASQEKRRKIVVNQTVLKERLVELHKRIKKLDEEKLFAKPVSEAEAPGYLQVIKTPMDLGTMKKKIDSGEYSSFLPFEKDFLLVCNNAITFNKPKSDVYKRAQSMLKQGLEEIKDFQKKWIETEGYDIDAADETFVQTQAALEQTYPNVVLKHVDVNMSLELPFFVGPRGSSPATRLSSLGSSVQAPTLACRERSWKGATPELCSFPRLVSRSYPSSCASQFLQANLDYATTSLLINGPDQEESSQALKRLATFNYADHCRSIVGTMRRMRHGPQEVRSSVDALLKLSEENIDILPLMNGGECAFERIPHIMEGEEEGSTTTTSETPSTPVSAASISAMLNKAAELSAAATAAQNIRLRGDKPAAVSAEEQDIGRRLLQTLTGLCELTVPARVANLSAVRSTLGVAMKREAPQQSAASAAAAAPSPSRAAEPLVEVPSSTPAVRRSQLIYSTAPSETSVGVPVRMVTCANCGLDGAAWTPRTRPCFGDLCKGCGSYYEENGRPRPVNFVPPAADTITVAAAREVRDDEEEGGSSQASSPSSPSAPSRQERDSPAFMEA